MKKAMTGLGLLVLAAAVIGCSSSPEKRLQGIWAVEGEEDVLYLGPEGRAIMGEIGEYKLSDDGKKLMLREQGEQEWKEAQLESIGKDEILLKDGDQIHKMKRVK